MKNLFILSIAMVLLLASCDNQELPALDLNPELTEITQFTGDNFNINVFAEAPLFVGYNRITLEIRDLDGNPVNTKVSVVPMMDMMTMRHSCPVEVSTEESAEGRFEFAAVFVMPSGEMGSWTLDVTVNGTAVSIPIAVVQPELPLLRSFVSEGDQEAKYFVAMVQPKTPAVGSNEIELAVFKKASMMSWPAVENLSIEMEPWMVSMDHGSPNNLSPVHTANGHYLGTVNFTMTGDWQIRLDLKEEETLCGSPYFDLFIP